MGNTYFTGNYFGNISGSIELGKLKTAYSLKTFWESFLGKYIEIISIGDTIGKYIEIIGI